MSGRYRGKGKTTGLLDRLFSRRKRSILYGLLAAAAVYLLMLVFGENPYLFTAVLRPPVMGGASFFGAFLVLGILLVLPFISPTLMDIVELAVALASVVLLILGAVTGLLDVLSGTVSTAASTAAEAAGLWCGVCLIHNIRE